MDRVLVGIGGFAGAIVRRLVDLWVGDRAGGSFPFWTVERIEVVAHRSTS
jgi:fluoride ion exporter CrcB/FEX